MLYKLVFKLVLYDLKKNHISNKHFNNSNYYYYFNNMNKAMNNEKKLNCLQSLNEK